MPPLQDIEGVLFDLDGTFADTAPDLAFALNETLRHFGTTPLPLEAIRPVVSHGGIALIRLGFAMDPGDPGFEDRRQYLLRIYQENISIRNVRQSHVFHFYDKFIPLGMMAIGRNETIV